MSNMGPYPNGQYNQQPGGYVPGGFGPRPDEKSSLGNWALGLGFTGFLCCGAKRGGMSIRADGVFSPLR